ncbi:hypothetical protein GQX74_008952 [Glossina fuscipes]|nr:hypothetical protein GQX74_008952 [Glossina fuscipes]
MQKYTQVIQTSHAYSLRDIYRSSCGCQATRHDWFTLQEEISELSKRITDESTSLIYACPSSTSITKTRRSGRRATTIRCIKLQPLSGSRELHASVNVHNNNIHFSKRTIKEETYL